MQPVALLCQGGLQLPPVKAPKQNLEGHDQAKQPPRRHGAIPRHLGNTQEPHVKCSRAWNTDESCRPTMSRAPSGISPSSHGTSLLLFRVLDTFPELKMLLVPLTVSKV